MHKKYQLELKKFLSRKIPGLNVIDITRHKNHSKIIVEYNAAQYVTHASCTPSDYRTMENIAGQIRGQIREKSI